ncbi:MAG: S41 family peptidase [Cytophagales bacterium]
MKKKNSPKKILTKTVIALVVFFSIVSCAKQEDYPSFPSQSSDPIVNFDAFWVGINDNYVFFPYDNVNWDDVYNAYRPKVTSGTSNDDLKDILLEMLSKLIDGHSLIKIGASNYGTTDPDYDIKHPRIYFDAIVFSTYIANNRYFNLFTYKEGKDTLVEFYTANLRKHPNTAYIRYFKFQNALENESQNATFNAYLSQIETENFDALILDLRSNGGGLATSFKNLVSKFVPSNYTWGYSKFRLGRDRYEMTPFLEEKIAFAGTTIYTKPLVILTDRYSFSGAELTVLALRNLPNVTIIGDTTGGAQGPIYPADAPNGGLDKDFTGNFKMPNGWIVQLAQKSSFDSEKNIFEGTGIPPDRLAIQSQTLAANGIDNVLEAAIDFLY